jgi:hypothetical protein
MLRSSITSSLPLALLMACLGGGETSPDNTPPDIAGVQQQKHQESFLFSDSLHDLRFLVSTHMDMRLGAMCQVDAVNLSMKGKKDIVQQLVLNGQVVPCPMPDGHFQAVEVADFNFDGVKEFRIMRPAADLTNPHYDYWLFDNALSGFAASRVLDSIQEPMFDYERQMVSSQWYAGPGHRGGSTYKYQNGVLTMVSNMEKFTEGDHERWVIWGMKDGRMQPVQEKQVPLPKH